MRLVCTIFTLYQIAFCYFFQASEKGGNNNDNDFKSHFLEPPIVVELFGIVLETKKMLSLSLESFYILSFHNLSTE